MCIGSKSGRGRKRSEIEAFFCSISPQEADKNLESFLSAVELSGIEGAVTEILIKA
jgi:hypothetical protein